MAHQHVRHPTCTSRGSQRLDDTVADMSSPGAVLRLRRSWPWRGGVSITVQRQGACRVWWCVRSAETLLGVVSHGTGKCPSPVFPRVHPDPNTSAVRSTGYCSGMIMRLRGSVCTRGVLQMLATANALYPAWFLRGRGWRTSSAPLPQWKRHPMPGGGAPVVSALPSWTVNNGEWLMVRGGGRTCSPG